MSPAAVETRASDLLVWRVLTPALVVGIAPEGVVGSIEIGRRCVVTDGAGEVFGRFRDLADAKALLASMYDDGEAGPLATRRRPQ